MDEYTRTWLLGKLVNYKDIGKQELDRRNSDFKEGAAVWNGEFLNSPPDDSLYYAVVFGLLLHYVRAARKMYSSAADLTTVSPEGTIATHEEAKLSQWLTEELNYHLNNWNNIITFIDDTMTQALKIGVCFGKVYILQDTMKEEFEDTTPQFEFDENGELIESEVKRFVRETVTKTKMKIEYIPAGQLVWDTTANEWDDAKWAMQIEIEKTEDELLDLIETDGYDREQVMAFIDKEKKRIKENPDELNVYKIAEFWGEMLTGPSKKRTEFVRSIMSNDGEFLLKKPTTDVYRKVDGTPFLPFEAGYLIREEGQIIGESLCLRSKEYQGETNCIRNQRRRAVENDLNERYLAEKSSEIEFSRFEGEEAGAIIYANDINGIKEVNHRDNTSTSYGELAAVEKNLIELTGVTPTLLGMPEQGANDTLGGMQLMSNASQVIVFDALLSYNNTFMEKLLTKAMHMSLQYMPIEELQAQGIDITKADRRAMQNKFRLRVDAGMGATSEQVKLNNYKTAYFITQQFIEFCDRTGLEPGGEARAKPAELLKWMLPLLNVKDPKFIPSVKEILANTEQMVKAMAQQEQAMQEQAQAQAQQEVDGFRQDAFRAGAEAAQQQRAQQDTANGYRGAQVAAAQGGQR